MTQNDTDAQESSGTASRRVFLGAAAALSTLSLTAETEATTTNPTPISEPDEYTPKLAGYVADNLVSAAHKELVWDGDTDIERTRFLLQRALTLIEAELLEPDDIWSVPLRPEWKVEYQPADVGGRDDAQ